ncbi:uncharacterized protein LTR77_000118 [Saxophila tyrrhenica]|uniref:Sde2 N-terminal ubiquitin domain-containing protein n=1 Tax=Saxophila tyrrhenica TaxID=1690608 RepID=A0AAV9PPY3_9PEZI|nr:hypothetical protein LTR77_000118 [Saxophila tyrrhenica]
MATTLISQSLPAMRHAHESASSDRTVTILLTTFAGLGLPRTLSLPVSASTSVQDVLQSIHNRLPNVNHTLIITTTDNKQLLSSSTEPVSTLLSSRSDAFLPLRLSARLCGGKGGFGSQLRAAGGRMSSRKKRDQNQNTNGSNRNLDGRRLRVVDEVRNVSKFMAGQKGEAERAEAEKKSAREAYYDKMTKQLELVGSGKFGGDKGKLDEEYVESKKQAEEQTQLAVRNYYAKQNNEEAERKEKSASKTSKEDNASDSGVEVESASAGPSEKAVAQRVEAAAAVSLWGWDEDEDDSEDEAEAYTAPMPETAFIGKGKAPVMV